MRPARLTQQRIIAFFLGAMVLFFGSNDYFGFGFLEARSAKGLLILTIGIAVVWGAYFAPTRQELRDDYERRRAERNE